ncbi:MAG: alpha amylase C-terminal domain-containing protein, partial [Gammaproteobacteria bacterium]
WIDCHDSDQSILSYIRRAGDDFLVVVVNFTPVPRQGYRLGVPVPGNYREVFNSDSMFYSGSNMGNGLNAMHTDEQEWMGRPFSLCITIPPLAGIVLKLES